MGEIEDITIGQPLEEEITQFMKELELIVKTAENIPIDSRLRFDPYLFLMWRKK